MNKTNIPKPDLNGVLKRTLKDDIPLEAEARMHRHFRRLKGTLDRGEARVGSESWPSARGIFRPEVLAFASAVLLIAGGVMHLCGNQSVLAHSIERLKIAATVSASLRQSSSMDCTVRMQGVRSDQYSYRVRWGATGITRVDMDAAGREERTLWVPDETVSMAGYAGIAARPAATATTLRDSAWRPALEFLTPAVLAEYMEKRYGLIQTEHLDETGQDEVLLVGREGQQVIEITINARTYLPIKLKKHPSDSNQTRDAQIGFEEVWFRWNHPIPPELLAPETPARNQ